MFAFLNSLLAWALVATTIPILIHLFTRKKLKVIPFSTLRFLKLMQQEKIRQVRLRQILLLLLRTLIIALLVLGFMRPTMKNSNFIVGQRARTAIGLIIDNSLSMSRITRGKSLFTQAQRKAQEIVQLLRPGDEITLIAGARPSGVVGDSPIFSSESALERLQKIHQTAASFDFQGSLEVALKALSETRSLNKEIYILSDNQFSVAGDGAKLQIPRQIRVYVLEWPDEKIRNLSITEIKVKNRIFAVNKVVEVAVTIANTGNYDEKGRLVHLILNKRRVAQQQVDVPMGQQREVTFRIVPEKRGYQLLTAEIENDQIPLDNRRYDLFSIPDKIRVLLLGATPEDRLYVRLALMPDKKDGPLIIEEKDSRYLGTIKLDVYDVVLLCNVPKMNADFARRLQFYLKNGGGAIVFLGDDVDLRNYNEEFFTRFKLGRIGETIGSRSSNEQILRFGEIKLDHPIFKGIFENHKSPKTHVESPAFRFAIFAHPSRDVDAIIRYSNRAPFLMERKYGDGALLTFMAAANATWSDLTYKGIFVPLINRAVRYVAGKADMPGKVIFAGYPAQINLGGEKWEQFSIKTPENKDRRIRPEIQNGRYVISLQNVQDAGFYHLYADGQQKYVWAANFDPDEILPTRRNLGEFEKLFGPDQLVKLPANSELEATLQRLRYGKEVWQIFIILALILLITEMLLFRESGETKGGQKPVAQHE